MHRCSLKHEAIVDAAPDAVWAMLRDWAGLPRWWPEDAPFPILGCEAIGDPSELPFGRRVALPGGQFGEEYLFRADDEARRLYYYLTNGSLPGMLNYVATTTVDDVGEGRSLMGFASNLDIPEDADRSAVEGAVLAVYDAIARGIGAAVRAGR